jgi:hypothetical protein
MNSPFFITEIEPNCFAIMSKISYTIMCNYSGIPYIFDNKIKAEDALLMLNAWLTRILYDNDN